MGIELWKYLKNPKYFPYKKLLFLQAELLLISLGHMRIDQYEP